MYVSLRTTWVRIKGVFLSRGKSLEKVFVRFSENPIKNLKNLKKIPKISLGKTQKSLKKSHKSQKNPKNLKKSQKTLKNPKKSQKSFVHFLGSDLPLVSCKVININSEGTVEVDRFK